MFYLVYAFFYLFSLLPWFAIYAISNFFYVLIYYVFGYRKKVVMQNLAIAFPEKSYAEHKKIAREFFKGLSDTFLESLKMLSISENEVNKRMVVTGQNVLDAAFASGKNITLLGGHFMNWEYANHVVALRSKGVCLSIYSPLSNTIFDKLMFKMRSRFGSVMLPTTQFSASYKNYLQKQHMLVLAADQKPGRVGSAFWLNFFGEPTPFVTGPEKGAQKLNNVVLCVSYYRVKRGFYQLDFLPMTTEANTFPPGAITLQFKQFLEECIRTHPSCYLWSHNRWKHKWKEEYKNQWIDEAPAPAINFV